MTYYRCDYLDISQVVDFATKNGVRITRQAVLKWAQTGAGIKIGSAWYLRPDDVAARLACTRAAKIEVAA